MRFQDLNLSDKMQRAVQDMGFEEPTPIQSQAIPAIMKGKDVIAQAQTGTGKTLSFMLPIMENIDVNKTATQALIVTPTRELAIQITNEAKKLIPAKEVNILAAYGGQDVEQQIRKLKNSIHLVIGTPGRLLDHIRRKSIDLSQTIDLSSNNISPSVGSSIKFKHLNKVLLPEPLGPITTTTSPLLISSFIPFKTHSFPKLLYKSIILITCTHSPFSNT